MSPAAVVRPELDSTALSAQRDAPLLSAMRRAAAQTRIRAGGPGHFGGPGAAADIRATLGTPALANDVRVGGREYAGARREAEDLAATAWGARRAWLMGGGAAAANLAWCLGSLREGEDVIVARDAPPSIVAGLVLTGAVPRWLTPRFDHDLRLSVGVHAADLDRVLDRYPAARQVILASPAPTGICSDLRACIGVATGHDALVYVDAGFGAHLAWHPELPEDAITAGAAGAVVGLDHGSGLSGAAVLLAGEGADIARLENAVQSVGTSSPLQVLASADAARRDLVTGGRERMDGVLAAGDWLSTQLNLISGLQVPSPLLLPAGRVDRLTIPVDVSELGYTGWQIEEMLSKGGTAVHGADSRRVFLRLGSSPSPARATAAALVADLGEAFYYLTVPRRNVSLEVRNPHHHLTGAGWTNTPLLPGEVVLTPRQAHQAPTVTVPAAEAVGQVAAESIYAGPGIPVVMAGERVTAQAHQVLVAVPAAGGYLTGSADPRAATIRVVGNQ